MLGEEPLVLSGESRCGQQVGIRIPSHWRSRAQNGLLDPVVVLAEVGVDSRVARQGTALHPPGHQALEFPVAHQGSSGVSLRARDPNGDTRERMDRAMCIEKRRRWGGTWLIPGRVGGGVGGWKDCRHQPQGWVPSFPLWSLLSRGLTEPPFVLAVSLENCVWLITHP